MPPMFVPSGIVKDRTDVWLKKEWMGTFNLWIVQKKPIPAIVYQLRSPTIGWALNKLDVSVGGHYEELETIQDGLREVKEELGKDYRFSDLISLGRKINVGIGTDGTQRNTVSDLFMIEDDSPLETYRLEEDEVYAICACPLEELYKVHTVKNYTFEVVGKKYDHNDLKIKVNKDIFPQNWDDYHFKIVLLLQRYFKGAKNLIY